MKKDKILAVLSEKEILEYYASFYGYDRGRPNKPFSDPRILPRKQKTPSMFIHQTNAGSWRWKEFSSGDNGDCFKFVMEVMNCDFPTALEIICRDFTILT